MISHEYDKSKTKWYQILLWDFCIPLALICFLAYYLDRRLAKSLLQMLVDLPIVGLRLYRGPFFNHYLEWHYFLFFSILFLILFAASMRTARIPGPGRFFMRWWQSLLHLKVGKETFRDPFPPKFDSSRPEIKKLIASIETASPNSRVLGFYKRFASDINQDIRHGKKPESLAAYFPIVTTVEQRFRHTQVIGGSGSGKSASVLAPMLLKDVASSSLSTLTINPKADLYLLKVLAEGIKHKKNQNVPTAVISFSRKNTLSYDPLLYGDADALTKKIMGSSEITHPFYKSFQETWLMSFFRVMKTEPLLVDRIMLRHLYHYLTKPSDLLDEIRPLCKSESNHQRLRFLATAKPESLAGVASHVSLFVEDESLTHIFDNPEGHLLNVRDVIRNGGNIFIEVDTSSKGPQGRALGRMILMEVQLLAGARQVGKEPKDIGLQVFLDEVPSFAYNGFIDLIDKCRSARIGLLLAHQSLGNLQRDNLSRSFKDELVDNCHTKIFLSVQDETAEWASRQLGTQRVVKKSLSIGHATGKTDTRARENQTLSFREELEPYVEPSGFNLGLGYGYAALENGEGKLIKGSIRLGFVEEKDLCSDAELFAFLESAYEAHPKRPRNGSLIDNDIPPGECRSVEKDIPISSRDLQEGDSNLRRSNPPSSNPARPEGSDLSKDTENQEQKPEKPPENTDEWGRNSNY